MQTDSWIIAESEKLQTPPQTMLVAWIFHQIEAPYVAECVCVFVFEHIDWHFNVTFIAMAAIRA